MPDGPLRGCRVVDLSTVGPGSRCSAVLRDLGADVLKVGAPAGQGRLDPPWHAYGAGRGMRYVRIDLRAAEGRDAYLRLAATADAIVESFRPGVADRLGIGYAEVSKVNADVVYCALSGYGREGPYSRWAGHDLNYLAVGGYLACQGTRADGGPAMPGATIADSAGGGLHGALSILAALVRRSTTGEGAFLDVSTTEGVLWLMSLSIDEYLATGVAPGPGTTLLTGRYACYDLYRAGDGKWLSVAAIEPAFFANLCRGLGCEEWIPHQYDDGRQEEIRAAFAGAFAGRGRDEWVQLLGPADACVAPVLGIAEIPEDGHLRSRRVVAEAERADGRRFRQLAPVVAGAARSGAAVPVSPNLSEDSPLREAGLGTNEISALREKGVIE